MANWFYAPAAKANTRVPILFPTFKIEKSHTIYMLGSTDGLTFTELGADYNYTDNTEIVRDGWLYDDGQSYWMVYGNTDATVITSTTGLLRSQNLKDWALVTHIDWSAAMTGVNMVYAAKWFVTDDGVPHVVAPVTDTGLLHTNFRLFETHPLNAAMTSWSAPVQIGGTGLRGDMIDPFIVKKGSTYYLWYKYRTTQQIEIISSADPFTGYTLYQTGDWAGWGSGVEAMTVRQFGSTWRVYMDRFQAGTGMAYSESTDDWATWSSLTGVSGPWTTRSGDIFKRSR